MLHRRPWVAVIAVLGMALAIVLWFRKSGPDSRVPTDECVSTVAPGDDVQASISSAGAGAIICLTPGTYRLTAPLRPLDGQTLVSVEPGAAVLSGSVVVPPAEILRIGSDWVIDGQTQEGTIYDIDGHTNTCVPADYQGCRHPEQVFLNDEPLWQVTGLEELSTGEFYFDYAADRIYLADDPSGLELEVGVATGGLGPGGIDVTVDGLVVERFNTPAQGAAVHTDTGWTVVNSEVRYNAGAGTYSADGSSIRDTFIHNNGWGGTIGDGDGVTLERVEVAFNGFDGHNTNWDGGGSKFVSTDGLTIRHSHYHDNQGAGIWFDIDNINTLIESNRVIDNTGDGIVLEIGYRATVANNLITGNGMDRSSAGVFGAGILIANTRDVEVYGNQVLDNRAGITGVHQPIGSGAHGVRETANLYVHDNTVRVAAGDIAAGLELIDCDCPEYFDSKNNRWEGNTYLLADPSGHGAFEWTDTALVLAEWQSVGMDAGVSPAPVSDASTR